MTRSAHIPVQGPSPQELIAALRRAMARVETEGHAPQEVVASGCPALDRLLPRKGFPRGSLIEWLAAGEAAGAESLAVLAAAQAAAQGGAIVVLDTRRQFYPPAAARAGIDLERLIVVQAATSADEQWALDQALRCPAVAAAWAWPERLDGRTFRRLQLAAEEGRSLGLLVRSERARHEPSWAEVRIWVEPLPALSPDERRRLRVELLHCRGGGEGTWVELEIDDATRTVHLASGVETAKGRRRARGA
jgi:protein ImuA